jgi:hypothetical protein
MYRLTWILFTLFSLILPILSAPVAIPEPEDTELDIRAAAAAHTGRVRVISRPLFTTLTFRLIGYLVPTWPR